MILEDLLGLLMMEGLERAGASATDDAFKELVKVVQQNLVKCQIVGMVGPD